jgi:hypothetical protein
MSQNAQIDEAARVGAAPEPTPAAPHKGHGSGKKKAPQRRVSLDPQVAALLDKLKLGQCTN